MICTLIAFTLAWPIGVPDHDVAILDMQNRWFVEDWGRVERMIPNWPDDDEFRCVLKEIMARHRAGTLNETAVPDRSCPPNYSIMNFNFPPVTDPAYLVCKKGGLVS